MALFSYESYPGTEIFDQRAALAAKRCVSENEQCPICAEGLGFLAQTRIRCLLADTVLIQPRAALLRWPRLPRGRAAENLCTFLN